MPGGGLALGCLDQCTPGRRHLVFGRLGSELMWPIVRLLLFPVREAFTLASAIGRFAVLNWPDTRLGILLRRCYLSVKVRSLGRNFTLHRGCLISGYHLIAVGDYSGIGEDTVVALGPGEYKLRMGNFSYLGPGCYVRNMNHRFDRLDIPYVQQGHDGTDIIIGDDVWVGARCILLAGTNIGDHSIVAAGSVVSTTIPPNSIAGGNPVRVLRKRAAPPANV